MKRRIEITAFKQRSLTIRKPGGLQVAWCDHCTAEVEMISADDASLIAGVKWRTIYQWVETNQIHFTESAEGLLQICVKSLSAGAQRPLAQSDSLSAATGD